MKKVSIILFLLCLLLATPLTLNANTIYTVDEKGNWVPITQTTGTQQTMPAYENMPNYSTNSLYNQNNSYSYSTGNYQTGNYSSQNTTNNMESSNPTIPTQYDTPYSIQVEKTKQPFNVNLGTADLNTMVNQIGDNILSKNRINKTVKFIVNSQSTINATTGLTNNITVYKGLIEYCENEDELAFVIGHEIGHAVKNHVLKTYGVNITTGLAGEYTKSKLSERVNNKWGRWATNVAVNQTTEAVQNKVSRGQEKDADLLSIDYVVAAGYNPLAGISIMNKIGNNYNDFWSDHPSTDKRVITMYNYIKQKYPRFIDQGFDTYSYKQALSNYIR